MLLLPADAAVGEDDKMTGYGSDGDDGCDDEETP